jgi:hypothetical protein
MADAGLTDADIFAPPTAAPQAPTPSVQPQIAPAPRASAPPPLSGNDDELIARAALAEGDPNNPDSWKAIGGVIRNRMAHSGKGAADVLSEPGQFESYSNGHIQGVDTNSPAYKAALAAIQGVKPGDVPYDSFYSPGIIAARGHGTPPFDPSKGTQIGTQLFGTGYQGAAPAGLSPEQQAEWAALQPQGPQTAQGTQPGTGTQFRNALGTGPLTAAQEAYFAKKAQAGGLDTSPGMEGTAAMPYALQPGNPLPTRPGAHYVDFDGVEHVVPGGALQQAQYYGQSALQGLVIDPAQSIIRATGGGIGTANADTPMGGALADVNAPGTTQGLAQGALSAVARQQQGYQLTHGEDPYAGAVRFSGQAIPAAASAALVPEIELPGAAASGVFGGLARATGGALTNAARGAAATLPTLATNDAPIAEQLATGALAGAVLPPVLEGTAKAGLRLAGVGASTDPEIAALAKTAREKYGINVRTGQIQGATDPVAAFRDSQLATAPGSGVAASNAGQRQAFSRAVAGTFGEDAPNLTPEVMQRARDRIGGVFSRVASNTAITDTDTMLSNLGQVVHDASQVLPEGDLTPLLRQVENIASTVQDGTLSGESYQALTRKGSALDRAQNSADPNIRYYAGQMRDHLDDALEHAASANDLADLQNARWEYKNLMTVKDLAAKAGVTGEIPPRLLSGAVNRSFKNRAFQGAGDLGELSNIAKHFMTEPPNSGTANRLGEMLKGGVLPSAAATGALMSLLHGEPTTAVQVAGGGVLATLGLAGARYGRNMIRGALNDNPIARASLLSGGQAPNGINGLIKSARPAEVPLSALAAHSLLYPAPKNGSLAIGTDIPATANVR